MDKASREARNATIVRLFEKELLPVKIISLRTGITVATIRKVLQDTYGKELAAKTRERRRKAEERG